MSKYLIIGLGQTAFSVAQFLKHQGCAFAAYEPQPSVKTENFQQAFPEILIYGSDAIFESLSEYLIWVVSPGVPLSLPMLVKARERGIELIGDIELFARQNKKPVLAVTGSNGKSTVVSLLYEMALAAGHRPALLGNIGRPVLDVFSNSNEPDWDLAILELSSFQLDTTFSLHAKVSCVLNVTEDHLDRHGTFAAYRDAKWRIYQGAEHYICNADDAATQPPWMQSAAYFSLKSEPSLQTWYYDNKTHSLCYQDKRYPVSAMAIQTQTHIANMLAALAMAQMAGFDTDKAFERARHFKGLPHRLVFVASDQGVDFYDDSKATNVGATLSSIQSIQKIMKGKLVIILGGQGKGACFEPLKAPLAACGRAAILMGQDQALLYTVLQGVLPCERVDSLKEAVIRARAIAQEGDVILLAPACASYDMFKGYADRGEQFVQIVHQTIADN